MKMKTKLTAMAVAAMGLAGNAQAAFINGGFEDGNLNGWTVQSGTYNGGGSGTIAFSPSTAHAYLISAPYSDPTTAPFDTPFDGNYMVRLNEFSGGRNATRISQTATMAAGETDIYINWGAVLEDPSHAVSQQPFFEINVKVNGVLTATEFQNASQGATDGWTSGGNGPTGSPSFWKSATFQLSGLQVGDSVEVSMLVADCSLSGHAGWAYLDGIGTVAPPTPPGAGVPDGGSNILMLGSSLLGLMGLSKKLRRRK